MFLGNFRSVRKNNNPNKQNEKKETLILLFSLSRKKMLYSDILWRNKKTNE